ncbi:MAG: thioether cross-link-forming SCIFF peptide maturase [Clostridiales bacterium]|jgi:uncharacterized protein|nr:thioether cross-link-forming SCIFF peptide maturase [Clostridiales bacterium]
MVHLFQNNGYQIALDAASGSVHLVDELAYDIIGLYELKTAEEIMALMREKYKDRSDIDENAIKEVLADIEELKKLGKLFSEDDFSSKAERYKAGRRNVKALCLNVAHDCNLRCGYCFAGKGKYRGDDALMSYETGKKALDFLIANSGPRRNLDVDFFGGEPLMNFEVVKRLVEYGRSREKETGKCFRFTLTTNGILLTDDVIAFCNREMQNVVLSLDGRRETNDRMRGKGIYDKILPGFQRFAESRGEKEYYIRGTYTHYNLDFAEDILHMADLGFTKLSMEPVVSSPTEDYALTMADVPVLCAQYDKLAKEMLERHEKGKGFTFYHFMIDLENGPCIVKRVSGCGVGTEYLAVTPKGELYPCHQFVGEPEFVVGNVYDGLFEHPVLEEFKSCSVYSREACKTCFAKYFCSGGCAANAYHSGGSINGIYPLGCMLHRKRVECALMLKTAEALRDGKL